ncbi:MAG: UvrD-helicase domain-containing protein, partial [Polaromonas sp.]
MFPEFPEVTQDSPLLRSLNPEPRAAVTLPNAPALIRAGARSGQTRGLPPRIAWRLHTGQVSPGGSLAGTFTTTAAKAMLARRTA